MSSLVEELQRDALSEDVPVGNLLRKALVVATKLKLNEFRQWIELELNGFIEQGPVPGYRRLRGRVVFASPQYGTRPVLIQDEELADLLSQHHERGSVPFLEELLRKGKDKGWLCVDFVGPQREYLLAPYQMAPGLPQLHIPITNLVPILDAVRNAILRWSLKLEEDGIKGEGLSFSKDERQTAEKEAKELGNPTNFIQIENMVNSTIQQGSRNAKQRHG
jgi:hypothetical protein